MPASLDEKWSARIVLGAAGAIFLVLAWPAFGRSFYTRSDLFSYFLPVRAFYSRALETGTAFVWYPDTFTGYYLHGEGAAGLLHPFNLAGYAWLPLDVAFNLELLRSYPLIFLGMFLLLRRWAIRRDAACFGALLFTFSGFNFLHYMHLNAIATVAHIPWLLWATDLSLRSGSRPVAALSGVFVAVLIGSGLLHGYPQYMFFAGLVIAGYLLLQVLGGVDRGRLLRWALFAACGVAIGAAQWLPTLSALAHSVRGDPAPGFQFAFSLEPINLVQLVGPYAFSGRVVGGNVHEFGLYAGAAIPPLCVWLWIRRKTLGAIRPVVLGAAVLGATGLVLSLGEYGGLYLLQVQIPLVGLFRAPCRYIVLVHLSLAILAAVAFDDLARVRAGATWRSLRTLALPLVLGGVAIFSAWLWEQSGATPAATLNQPSPLFLGLVLILLATALVVAAARGRRVALLGLTVLAALDLGIYGLSYVRSKTPISLESIERNLDRPPAAPGDRIRTFDNYASLLGLRNVGGYAAMQPDRQLGHRVWDKSPMNEQQAAALRLMGVTWVRIPSPDRSDGQGYAWIELNDPMPRARLVPSSSVSLDVWGDVAQIDIRHTALVSRPLDLGGGPPGRAHLLRDEPGSLRVDTQAQTRQLLVVSESHHPGWRATIDGRPAEIVSVYADFIGCVVEPGEHRVELTFDPPSLRKGVRLSGAGLMAATVIGGMTLLGRRRAD